LNAESDIGSVYYICKRVYGKLLRACHKRNTLLFEMQGSTLFLGYGCTRKYVSTQAIRSTLQDNSIRTIIFHDFANYFLEDIFVGLVVDAVLQREID